MKYDKRGLATRKEMYHLMKKRGYTITESGSVIDDVLDMMAEVLVSGKGIRIPHFGTFELEVYPETQIKLFGNEEPTTIPEHNILRFRQASDLKQAIKIGEPLTRRLVGYATNCEDE